MALAISHDAQTGRFETLVDGGQAFVKYERPDASTLDITYTYVPIAARGQGVGAELVKHALEHARSLGHKVIPTCPFVSRVVADNPDYRSLLRD